MKKRFVCALLTLILLVSLVPAAAIGASAASRSVSEAAITVLKQLETFQTVCDTDGYNGYHTKCEKKAPHGAHTITQKNADTALRKELATLDTAVNTFASSNGLSLTQSKHDALVLFSFQNGTTWMNGTGDFRAAVISGKKGADFLNAILNWSTKDDDTRRKVESNMYLNGVYSISAPTNFITVTFNAGDGDINGASVRDYAYDTSTNPAPHLVPTLAGSTFAGWYDENDKLVTILNAGHDGAELTARWMDNGNKPWSDEDTTEYQVAVSQLLSKYAYTCTWVEKDGSNITFSVAKKNGKSVLASDCTNESGNLTITKIYIDKNGNRWGIIAEKSLWVRLPGQSTTTSTTTSTSGNATETTVTVTNDYVNRREKASIYSNKTGSYTKGTSLRIIATETKDGFLWGNVAKEETGTASVGWVALMYTDYDSVRSQTSTNYATGKVIATGFITYNGYVNVRSNAGTTNAIVGSLYKGTEVNIYETKFVNGLEWGRTDTGWFCMTYANVTRLTTSNTANTGSIDYVSYVFTGKTTGDITVYDAPDGKEVEKTTKDGTETVTLKEGTTVTVTSFAQGDDSVTWGKVSQGWIAVSDSEGYAKDVKLDSAKFTATTEVTVRSKPGNDGTRINTLSKNVGFNVNGSYQVVVVNETLWGYADVLDSSTSGWINLSNKYVSRDGAAAAAGSTGKIGTVIGADTVRIRNGGSLNGKIIGSISQGTTVTILGESNGWYKIEYDVGAEGSDSWIYGQYLQVQEGTLDSTTTSVSGVGIISNTYGGVNVRATPGTAGSLLGKIAPNTQVNILETKTVGTSQWGRVEQGWICMDYVQLISDLPADVLAGLGITNTTGAVSGTTTTGAEVAMYTGKTIVGDVIVYAEADTTSKVIRVLGEGENVTIHELKETKQSVKDSDTTGSDGSSITTTTTTTYYWARLNDGYIMNPQGSLVLDSLDEAVYTVTESDTLNVRDEAGTTGTTVQFKLNKGDQVKITNVKIIAGNVWGNVECDQGTGWASLAYMTKGAVAVSNNTTNNTTGTGTTTGTTGTTGTITGSTGNTGASGSGSYLYGGEVVNTDSLNVRKTASETAAKVTTLKRGATIHIYETCIAGGLAWGRCDSGWVYLNYVKLTPVNGAISARVIFNEGTTIYSTKDGGDVVGTYSRMAVVDIWEQVGNMVRTDLGWISTENLF